MQNQYPNLVGCRVSQSLRILFRNIYRDRHVSHKSCMLDQRREGQDVGRAVLSSKALVERLQFNAARQENIDNSAETGNPLGSQQEAFQGGLTQLCHRLLDNHHRLQPSPQKQTGGPVVRALLQSFRQFTLRREFPETKRYDRLDRRDGLAKHFPQ